MNLRFTGSRVWLNMRDLRKGPFLPSLAYRKKDKLERKALTVDLDRWASPQVLYWLLVERA